MARQSAPGVPVLLTRPKAEGESFAAALTRRFGLRVRPVVSPLFAPRNLTPELPDGDYAAVVFTSAQAVEAVRPMMSRLPTLAWCVGSRTAQAARAAGFVTRTGGGDANALVSAIVDDPPDGSILYLRGVDTSINMLENLINSGMHTEQAVVYVQQPQPLTPEAIALLKQPLDIVAPVFSPRTAQLLREAVPDDALARLHIVAMSANVSEALGDLPCGALTVASRPDALAMLDAVETLLVGLPLP